MFLWFVITKEYKRDSKWSTKPGAIPNPFPSKTDGYSSENKQPSQPTPPAQLSVKGEFSGVVWTSLTSEWDRHESLKDIDIQTRRAKFWRAQLHKGVLTMTPDIDKKNLKPVSMELTGCSVKIVTECLGAKSYWWKKGPLEISHHDKNLLEGKWAQLNYCGRTIKCTDSYLAFFLANAELVFDSWTVFIWMSVQEEPIFYC